MRPKFEESNAAAWGAVAQSRSSGSAAACDGVARRDLPRHAEVRLETALDSAQKTVSLGRAAVLASLDEAIESTTGIPAARRAIRAAARGVDTELRIEAQAASC
jgi:hypothetical protein